MTKNTKTIIYSLLACLLLLTGFELTGPRLRWGDAWINDSTPSLVALNKGILVNGKLSTSNYAGLNNGVRFADTDIYIDDDGLDLRYSVETNGSHIFSTKSLTTLMTVDSIYGFARYISGAQAYGSTLVYEKLVKGVTASAVNGTQTYAHGITNGRIISWDCFVRVDTAGVSGYGNDYLIKPYANTFMGSGYQYTAYVDSLNVGTKLGLTADAIKSDSVFFFIRYIP